MNVLVNLRIYWFWYIWFVNCIYKYVFNFLVLIVWYVIINCNYIFIFMWKIYYNKIDMINKYDCNK